MGVPSPAIPSFTDGTVVHQADLNALASNLTNLYAYNQAGFFTQRPTVLVNATSVQSITQNTDTLLNFQNAVINTDNMWTASVPNHLTIQHAGIYLLFAQWRIQAITGASLTNGLNLNLLVNGTSTTNSVSMSTTAMMNTSGSSGIGVFTATPANLAAGATVYADVFQNGGSAVNTVTDRGSSFLGAVFLTNAT